MSEMPNPDPLHVFQLHCVSEMLKAEIDCSACLNCQITINSNWLGLIDCMHVSEMYRIVIISPFTFQISVHVISILGCVSEMHGPIKWMNEWSYLEYQFNSSRNEDGVQRCVCHARAVQCSGIWRGIYIFPAKTE